MLGWRVERQHVETVKNMITTNSFHYCQVPPIIAGLTLGSSGSFFID
jgi:hypothetical protein